MSDKTLINRRIVLKSLGATAVGGLVSTGRALAGLTCDIVWSRIDHCDNLQCHPNEYADTQKVKFYFRNNSEKATAKYNTLSSCSGDWDTIDVQLDPNEEFTDTLEAGESWAVGIHGCAERIDVKECHYENINSIES